jgi:nitroimidazol reductase NimA-like FMN-containing flavoprotein (pyridoxamine 5'-phosphate oxidase superfamily)
MQNFVESREEMEAILREMSLGFLGMAAAEEPYVVPLNYAYIDGKILFHCALAGKKLDQLAANPTVCFTVARQFGAVRRHEQGDPCHMDNDSVVCYGTARVIQDAQERTSTLNAFHRYYRPDAEELAPERTEGCAVVEIAVAEMTGRRERERKLTCWRYRFQERG